MCYGYLNVFFGIENVQIIDCCLLFNFIVFEQSIDGYFFSFISDCDYFIGGYIYVM